MSDFSETSSSIPCALRLAAKRAPEDWALVSQGLSYTYRECDEIVTGRAENLRELGFKAGDRVAIQAENSVDYILLLLALFRAGITACPLSDRLPDQALTEAFAKLSIESQGYYRFYSKSYDPIGEQPLPVPE